MQPTPAPTRQQTSRKADQPKRVELKDVKTAERLRQELKRRGGVAVMNPTDQNMKDYLELWQVTRDKGAVFVDNQQRVVWRNPSLDYAQKRPVNNSVIKIYGEGRIQNEEQRLKVLAKERGLIFFFCNDCPYCRIMAPTLKVPSDKCGIEVLPVSVDDTSLPEFPNPRDGRTQTATWGIERVPALFIGSRQTSDRAPVGFGMMVLIEVVNQIFVLTGTRPDDNF